MTVKAELSYYEYWLTKEELTAYWAIRLIVDYTKFKRSWEAHESDDEVINAIYLDIKSRLNSKNASHIFSTRSVIFDNDKIFNNEWVEKEINLDESKVWVDRYIKFIYENGYELPNEFKVFIGVVEIEDTLNEKQQQKHDKVVCQGIARTLWDEYPDMTIEDMQYHKAIQVYGSGKLYSTDTTLRRWLSEVDPRKVKTGPKKKI